MNIKQNEIERAIRLFFRLDDVFEVRMLEVCTLRYTRPHVESGYFTVESIGNLIRYLTCEVISARGVYVTANPVNPALLARANNRIIPAGRNPLTTDADIISRRWLLIDCDAKRPAGIPSSNAEHDKARAKAIEIRDGLAKIGFSAPIEIDSGNGAQLMYSVDLPCNDDGLIQKILQSLACCSNEFVDIDQTVHNPARIWRLPGTFNCKGDQIEDRVHREAQIICAPEELKITDQAILKSILRPKSEVISIPEETRRSEFNIDEWIAKYAPELREAQPWQGGRKWVFDVCPFNDTHTNKSAVLIEQASGAIAFTCHHNSCSDKDWHALRELREGERIMPRPVIDPGVNLSKMLEKKEETPTISEKESVVFHESLMDVPGIVREIMDITLDSAPRPNKPLAFIGALSFMSFLCGRGYTDVRDNRSALYFVSLANSGTGKEHPRKINSLIANEIGQTAGIADAFASGEGLEDAMALTKTMLFQTDEIDNLFSAMKNNSDLRYISINERLLKFYSASSGIFPMRKLATIKKGETTRPEFIVNPSLTLFGTAVPEYFFESVSERFMSNGLVARCMIFPADKRCAYRIPKRIEIDSILVNRLKNVLKLKDGHAGNLQSENPVPIVVHDSKTCEKTIIETAEFFDNLYIEEEKNKNQYAMAIWSRAFEKACKLALIYAISENQSKPIISSDGFTWARELVCFSVRYMLGMFDAYAFETDAQKYSKKVMQIINQCGGKATKSELFRGTGITRTALNEILDTLLESEQITMTTEKGKTKTKNVYQLHGATS